MIDLRSPDATLSEHAQRYVDLLPVWSPQLQQRMDYTLKPDALRLPRIKPAWLSDRPCTLSPEQAVGRAYGRNTFVNWLADCLNLRCRVMS